MQTLTPLHGNKQLAPVGAQHNNEPVYDVTVVISNSQEWWLVETISQVEAYLEGLISAEELYNMLCVQRTALDEDQWIDAEVKSITVVQYP